MLASNNLCLVVKAPVGQPNGRYRQAALSSPPEGLPVMHCGPFPIQLRLGFSTSTEYFEVDNLGGTAHVAVVRNESHPRGVTSAVPLPRFAARKAGRRHEPHATAWPPMWLAVQG